MIINIILLLTFISIFVARRNLLDALDLYEKLTASKRNEFGIYAGTVITKEKNPTDINALMRTIKLKPLMPALIVLSLGLFTSLYYPSMIFLMFLVITQLSLFFPIRAKVKALEDGNFVFLFNRPIGDTSVSPKDLIIRIEHNKVYYFKLQGEALTFLGERLYRGFTPTCLTYYEPLNIWTNLDPANFSPNTFRLLKEFTSYE